MSRHLFVIKISLIFLFLSSCAGNKKISGKEVSVDSSSAQHDNGFTVDLAQDSNLDSLGQVEVDQNYSETSSFGPSIPGSSGLNDSSRKSKVHGLFIGPIAYDSFSSLQAVQSLQMKGLKFHLYSGSGLGLLFAAFLAEGKSVDQIEWFFFKIKNELAKYKIYSKEWSDYLIDEAMSFIKKQRIEDLSGSLVVPVFHQKTKKMHYFTRGSIQKYLRANLQFFSDETYVSAINRSLYPTHGLKSAHGDLIVCIDSLGKKLKFKDIDHFLLGLLNRLIMSRESEKRSCDQVLAIEANAEIDDITLLDRFRVLERKQIDSQANFIAEILKDEKNP
jgi:hypothetical protein